MFLIDGGSTGHHFRWDLRFYEITCNLRNIVHIICSNIGNPMGFPTYVLIKSNKYVIHMQPMVLVYWPTFALIIIQLWCSKYTIHLGKLRFSLTWIKAIWGWFPLLTMIPGFGRSEVAIISPWSIWVMEMLGWILSEIGNHRARGDPALKPVAIVHWSVRW